MKAIERYGLRLQRKRYLARAWRKGRGLELAADRTWAIQDDDVLCFCTLRDERPRLAYFLDFYRSRGVRHFLFVDNGSKDGSREYLSEQPDCSVWVTDDSYKSARFGIDWINHLLRRYGHDHWCLTVDADEFLLYPYCDTRPLPALTYWLENAGIRSFGAMVLDMYPKGRVADAPLIDGQDPFETACWFDTGNYVLTRNWAYGNLWVQGGPRARVFFADKPYEAPALNKIPLVRWHKRYSYVSSTHMLLPRGLNLVFDEWGGEKASGVLMHAKFLNTFGSKVEEELKRKEHYASSREYAAYLSARDEESPDIWNQWSVKFADWRQLEILGLVSKGNWA